MLHVPHFTIFFPTLSNRSQKVHRATLSLSVFHKLLSLRRPEHLGLSLLSLLDSCRRWRVCCFVELLLEKCLDISIYKYVL